MKKIFLTIVLAMTICLFGITAYAAEETVTLDIEDGAITITATGYTQGTGAEIPYTGSYILTGTTADDQMYNNITINGVADGQTITLKDLDVETMGPYPLSISGEISLEATGNVSLIGAYPAVYSSGKLTITGDADIVFKGNNAYGIQGNADITCNSLTILNDAMNTPAIYGDLTANVTNDINVSGYMVGTGNMDIVAGGDVTLTAGITIGLSGHLCANVQGNLTFTNNAGAPIVGQGVELIVGGDVLFENESGSTIYGAIEANVGGNFTVIGGGATPVIGATGNVDIEVEGNFTVHGSVGAPLINISEGNMNVSASSIEIENGGSGQAISGSSEYVANFLATDGDINIKTNTVIGGPILISSTLTALEGDIIVVNEGDAFVVTNELVAMAKNIYLSGANTTYPLSASNMTLFAEENIELTTNGGDIAFPNSTPSLVCGKGLVINKGEETFETNISDATFEYNGNDQKPEITVIVDGTEIDSDDYTVKYYDENGAQIEETKELGVYWIIVESMDSSWIFNGVFEIVEKDITDAVITVVEDTFTFNGEEQSVEIVSVTIDGMTLTENDYQVSGNKATNAGEYELKITAAEGSNFTGTATLKYVIEKKVEDKPEVDTDDKTEEPIPNTGDSTNIGIVLFVSVLAMFGVVICGMKKEAQN